MRANKPWALITGGAGGIGLATVTRLAEDGFLAVMVDRDVERGEAGAEVLRGRGLAVEFRAIDITDDDAVKRLIEALPPLAALVNCAGILKETPFFELNAEDFRRDYEVNLIATFRMAQAAARKMKPGAKIVNISSRAFLGDTDSAQYVSSKGAVVSLTRALAMELAPFGIAVNAIGPGLIDTPMARSVTPERWRATLARQPTGKAGRPEDVANAVSFLASPRTDFITGQMLLVDGGKALGGVTAGT